MAIVALYAIFVMPQPDFESQIDLLIIPQNITSVTNIDNTINDMIFIAESEMQNNVLLQQYEANVEINKMTEHNIISISIYANSQKDITSLSSEVVIEIVNSIKKYYAINQDFEIKVAHIQDVQKTNIAIWGPYMMMSLGAIILISGVLLIFNIIDIVRERSDYDEKNIDGEKIFAQYNKTQNQPIVIDNDNKVNSELVNENIQENQDKLTNESDNKQQVQNMSELEEEEIEEIDEDLNFEINKPADKNVPTDIEQESITNVVIPEGLPTIPGNLPVADISEFGGESQKTEVNAQTESIQCDDIEPTEEELKARLNELLNGKL
jgi:hypothetical protein